MHRTRLQHSDGIRLRRSVALTVLLALVIAATTVWTTAPESQAATGTMQAGAAKISIEPRPDDYDGTWETEGCAIAGDDVTSAGDHVADFRSNWPENPNCLYMGGFGIGPANPITAWDQEYGLWVRSIALGNGAGTVVLTVIDGAYYLGDYISMCDTCGAFEIAESMGEELGIDPAGFVISATHAHSSPDFIGAWGGVPEWYFTQVEEAIRSSIRDAVASMEPARVEFGEVLARDLNRERRDLYRSAETETLTWVRAVNTQGEAIGTLGAYAAHPTSVGTNDGVAHADWLGPFADRLEERFGGVGMHIQTGLGNHSTSGGLEIGAPLADLVPAIGTTQWFEQGDVAALQTFWNQPVTNAGLLALGVPQFFDRPIQQLPAQVQTGPSAESPCFSASPLSINTAVTAMSVGPLTMTTGPGELFSNLTNTIKEKGSPQVVLPLAIANDGLGYIIQEFEFDPVANEVIGFAGLPFFEYEEAYALDRCFGDKVLEETIATMAAVHEQIAPAEVHAPAPASDADVADEDVTTESKSPLPTTGGGMLLLGMSGMGAGLWLRRRGLRS